MTQGATVWVVIAVIAALLVVVTTALPAARTVAPSRVVGWFLGCWAGRIVLLALWAEAGFHLLCQRP